MNLYQERLMDKPAIKGDRCCFCGRPKNSAHHVVPRSQGGSDGPTIPVCGFGNESGCHGLLHAHKLHVNWNDEQGWVYLYTPKAMKLEKALELDGWRAVIHEI